MYGRGEGTDPFEGSKRGAEVLRLLSRDVAWWIHCLRAPMGDNEKEALAILRQTALFYSHISNLIKVKDASWVEDTKALSVYAKIAFKRFFSPRYRVNEEVFKLLNIEEHDRKV